MGLGGPRDGRISIFLPSLDGGGAEKVMVFLANALAARGHSVDLVLAQAIGPRLSEVDSSVSIVDLSAPRMMRSVPGLVRYLRKTRPAAALSALTHANVALVAAAKLSGYSGRLLVSERNSLAHVQAAGGAKSWARTTSARIAYRSADGVLAVSKALEDELRIFLGPNPPDIRTIHNPIDCIAIQSLAAEAPDIDLPGKPENRFVAVGRLAPQKGLDTLIRAFATLPDRNKRTLVILGEGPLRPELECLIASLDLTGRVTLPGFVGNVYSVLARSKVFVLSSRYEGLPNALLEALASGCHVVSTDCPTGPAEILRSPADGRLVPVDDTTALAQAMAEAMKEPNRKDGRQILARFAPDRIVDAYIDALAASIPDASEMAEAT